MGVNLNDILGSRNESILEDKTKKQMNFLMIGIAIVVILIAIVAIKMIGDNEARRRKEFAEKINSELNTIALQVKDYYQLYVQEKPGYEELIGKSQDHEDAKKIKSVKREGQVVRYKHGWYFLTREEMKKIMKDSTQSLTSKEGYLINYEASVQPITSEKDVYSNNFLVYLDGVRDLRNQNKYYEHVDIAAVANNTNPVKIIYINNAEDMAKLEEPKNWGSKFLLNADIDMSNYLDWQPVGNENTKFTGIFDGKGYSIKNFNISKPNLDNAGLFGYVGESGVVNNLVMIDSVVTGGKNTGIVAAVFDGTITNSKISGTATSGSKDDAGGIFGTFSGNASNILCSANASGYNNVGGFAGIIEGGTVSNVFVREGATVTGNGRKSGGFAGYITNSKAILIDKCYAKAKVHAIEGQGGGFAGYISLANRSSVGNYNITISHCYSLGQVVNCPHEGGGFVGEVFASGSSSLNLSTTLAYTSIDKECSEYRGGYIGKINEDGSINFNNNFWIKEALSTNAGQEQLAGVGNERNENQYVGALPESYTVDKLNGWSDGTNSWKLVPNAPTRTRATLVGEPTQNDWSIFDKQ